MLSITPIKQKLLPSYCLAIAFFSFFSFQTATISAQHGVKTIVLDAGHGGHDPGNLGTGRFKNTEKNVALTVSLLVGKYIEENFADVKVIYTRDKDVFIPLHKRAEIANKAKADLFISIHCNSAKATEAHGTETFVMGSKYEKKNLELTIKENSVIYLEDDYEENYDGLDPNNPDASIIAMLLQSSFQEQSIKFANMVENQFQNRVKRKSRGVKQQVLLVMYRTTMPSVLVELGFLTHKAEEDFLNSPEGQEYMASAIYRAFKEYKNSVESIDEEAGTKRVPKNIDNGSAATENSIDKKDSKPEIEFRIQLISSHNKLDLQEDKSYKKLGTIDEIKVGSFYKYTHGKFSSYKEAKIKLSEIKEFGYESAFIIALKNGEPTALKEVLKVHKKN
jgi:N-acetylmuramoyl-L-alanine amidase